MRKQRLTKKQQLVNFWEYVAKKIELDARLGRPGMCAYISQFYDDVVSQQVWLAARDQLDAQCNAFWRNNSSRYMDVAYRWRPRVLLAYFLALEAADGKR